MRDKDKAEQIGRRTYGTACSRIPLDSDPDGRAKRKRHRGSPARKPGTLRQSLGCAEDGQGYDNSPAAERQVGQPVGDLVEGASSSGPLRKDSQRSAAGQDGQAGLERCPIGLAPVHPRAEPHRFAARSRLLRRAPETARETAPTRRAGWPRPTRACAGQWHGVVPSLLNAHRLNARQRHPRGRGKRSALLRRGWVRRRSR